MKHAKESHELRMASASAAAGLTMALVGWTGVGGAGAAGGWVIAMIASGVQYQIDSNACTAAHC